MFTFRLEPLLKHRKRQEEGKQRELALVAMEFSQVRNRVDELTAQRKGAIKKFTKLSEKTDNVNVLRLYENFITGRGSDIANGKKEVEKIAGMVKAKREELLEYVKKRRALERLREKKRLSYAYEENRKERLLNDEIASQMWHRKALG